ncbi:hypothetical protein I6F35_02565 [Bradyrhizobium sp. BRP22]|uniref:hypothetical protein n=1 Tax=Bradyrhizobium sp. BRP22 TaxID=2793821 RepID=UPI001CD7CCC6|nr:hypothetical protein [Bradyrhizobium sp. BRP22]MCA1452096.1 hypothetical protein [Bradyrhizobium sp. BRP22]
MSQPKFTSDYAALKDAVLGAITDLLNHVGWGADDESERRDIISLCTTHIIENIDKIATTREQAFAMIDEIAEKLRADWDEMHEEGQN